MVRNIIMHTSVYIYVYRYYKVFKTAIVHCVRASSLAGKI